MLEAIDHVNIVVRDLPVMVAFYGETLGLKMTKQVTISGQWIDQVVGLKDVLADVVYLDLSPGARLELIRYRAPISTLIGKFDQPNTPGLRHLAFRVNGIESLVDRLRLAGLKFVSDVQQVPTAQVQYAGGARKRIVYLHDPEGNLLELCEYKA